MRFGAGGVSRQQIWADLVVSDRIRWASDAGEWQIVRRRRFSFGAEADFD